NKVVKDTNMQVVKDTNMEPTMLVKDTTSTNNTNIKTNNNPVISHASPSSSPKVVSSYINNLQKTAKAVVTSLFPSMQAGRKGLSENLPSAAAVSSHQAGGPSVPYQTRQAGASHLEGHKGASPRAEVSEQVNISIEGVSDKFMAMGIKALRDRKITNIERALGDIKSEMAVRKINSPEYYFLGLCRKKKDFSGVVVEKKSGAEKTEKEFREIDREIEQDKKRCSKNPMEQQQEYEEKYPEEMKEIKNRIRVHPNMNFPMAKAPLYVAEFQRLYPDKA
ncbi:MAG: hypothetical protein AB1633_05825, partial [Elusimicrobiota bacterium]